MLQVERFPSGTPVMIDMKGGFGSFFYKSNLPDAQVIKAHNGQIFDFGGAQVEILYTVEDLLPAEFHREHTVKEFTVCYLNEALEGEEVALNWQLDSEGNLHVHAAESTGGKRVFSAEVLL